MANFILYTLFSRSVVSSFKRLQNHLEKKSPCPFGGRTISTFQLSDDWKNSIASIIRERNNDPLRSIIYIYIYINDRIVS